jgi:putative spermidine/putrescine transport system permease protein
MVRGVLLGERLGRVTYQAAVGAAFVFMVLPIALVLWLSFFSNEILSLPPEGYSLRWYAEVFAQRQFISGFRTSLNVALLATACGLLATTPASFALTRMRFRGREAFLQLLMSPLIVPAIVIGAALYMSFVELEVLTGWPVVGSVWGLAIGHTLITVPWSIRLITANLIGVDRSVEEAALSLGASPLVAALKVTLPLIWPGVVAAALFSFVVSFGNLEISLLLVTPGQTTLPIAILQYLEWKIDPTIAAVSALQIAIVGGGLLITDRFVSLTKVVQR